MEISLIPRSCLYEGCHRRSTQMTRHLLNPVLKKSPGISLTLLFIIIMQSAAVYASASIKSKVDEYINTLVKMEKFSGSILVAQKGKILISKGYGDANLECNCPNTPKTKYSIGSITKQFTAMAIMQLQEKGLLKVDDPINKYIADYPNGERITIHHLLTHTSGVPNYSDLPDFWKTITLATTISNLVERFKNLPLDFVPGEKYKYSNSGYVLLALIIEKVSGSSYESFLQDGIFHPLKMNNTGYFSHEIILKNRASGYLRGRDGIVNAHYFDASTAMGAGCLYSTVEDLYLWDRTLYTDKLVNKGALERIFTPFKQGYGYGWGIDSMFTHKRIGHDGGGGGFYSDISRYVDDDVCIIVLSNFGHAPIDKIKKDLAAIVFNEKYEIPRERKIIAIRPELLNSYVGQYELFPNFLLTVSREKNRLFVGATGQEEAEIFPEAENEFFYKVIDAQISFTKNDSGRVDKLILHQAGNDIPASKVP